MESLTDLLNPKIWLVAEWGFDSREYILPLSFAVLLYYQCLNQSNQLIKIANSY